jgi:hypothetical protein
MNRRMERLFSDEEYGNEPAETRKHVNTAHVRIAIAEVARVLDRVMAEIAARKSGGAA